MKTNVFRFVVNRPPKRLSDEELAGESVATHPPDVAESELLVDLRRLRIEDDRAGMRSRSRLFISRGAPDYIASLDDLVMPIKIFDQWLVEREPDLSIEEFVDRVAIFLNTSIDSFIKSDEYLGDRQRVADSLLAQIIAGPQRSRVPAHLARAMRIFGILEQFVRDKENSPAPGGIGRALQAFILLPASLYPLPRPQDRQEAEREKAFNGRLEAYKALEERAKDVAANIARHETAIDEIMDGYEFDRKRDRARASEDASLGLTDDSGPVSTQPITIARRPATRETASVLSPESVELLSGQTTELLSALRINITRIDVVETVGMLNNRVAGLARDLTQGGGGDPIFVMIGGSMAWAEDYNGTGGKFELPERNVAGCPMPDDCRRTEPESPTPEDSRMLPGPGDLAALKATYGELMIVEQTLQRYDLGEIAHIENVLVGERKERTHRRKDTTDDITVIETELSKETERDLQTTERFELQTETQKVISEDTSAEAGLNVSGKYGPTVEFSANASFGRDTSSEQSNSTATSYSRDVTERAVSRIQERVLERRTNRVILEIEETNLHQLNNIRGEEHIAGIYRWVDKVYSSQVVNYGQRAMIEIIIPEPAAFLKFAMANRKSAAIDLQKPRLPGYCRPGTSTFVPLRPNDICGSNYMFWVTRYGVTGVKPPPPPFKIVGKAYENSNVHNRFDTEADGEVRVPDGYLAQRAWIVDSKVIESGADNIALDAYVGRRFLTDNPTHYNKALNDEDGDLPISLVGANILAYVANIEVECRLSREAREAWQLETFEAIMLAYNEQVADYENRLSALEIEQGVAISGSNPLRNEQFIRDELKRSAISIFTGQHFDDFSALRKGVGEEGYPQLHLSRVTQEGPYIRFFEQAFEWEHVAYLFYPYFWGRKDDWTKNILLDDNDPMFAEFLRAGAARVVVPVRPGFEDAVAGYLANGWLLTDGEDLALPVGEDLDDVSGLPLLSLLAEVKARQGYDGSQGAGTLAVTTGSADVTGAGTNFSEKNDRGREIHILGVKYQVAAVASATAITLDRDYEGSSQSGVPYSLGVQFIGEAWQVRVPTSLVFLENGTSTLPEFA